MELLPADIIRIIYGFCTAESRPEFRITCRFVRNSLIPVWHQWVPSSQLAEYRKSNPEIPIYGLIYDAAIDYTDCIEFWAEHARVQTRSIKRFLCTIGATVFMTILMTAAPQYEGTTISKSYLISDGKCEMVDGNMLASLQILDVRTFTISSQFITHVIRSPGLHTRKMLGLLNAVICPPIGLI